MGLTDTVFGSPGQTTIHQTPGMRPPGFGFAKSFFDSLMQLSRQPYPSYQGQLDPGLSPTMQDLMRRSQGYAQAGPPEILAGVQGSLGRFMNPSFINPAVRAPMGFEGMFQPNPATRGFNGTPIGNLQNYGGPAGAGGGAMGGAPSGLMSAFRGMQNGGGPGGQSPDQIASMLSAMFRAQAGGAPQGMMGG